MLNFLFRVYARDPQSPTGKNALAMNLFTLRKMAAGGMHDHLGGGFARYSVDAFWHVPHFEKMLYDQAQLAVAYLDAFQITRDPAFEKVARDVLDYVRRDMTAPEGGFYSAEDADSEVPGDSGHRPKPRARSMSGRKRKLNPCSADRRRCSIFTTAWRRTATRRRVPIRTANLSARIF